MASTESEPIMGVWGLCPQRGPGAEPMVKGSECKAPLKPPGQRGQGAKPPEAETIF